ncbi:hypothetical protein ILUMI_22936 [Ignelater luminosus]|uniref:HTH psq-type domain-containing protein n=1 Tax=Ignelater luminosus TaxID=2038154 RepID=A0A8K0G248_IGNLU|nr:hypothetical protein ILUMI_22936 [Ignelater luminosus]
MPNTYIRKVNAKLRGLWTSNDLQSAIKVVKSGIMGVNEEARSFNIPKTTLKRRMKSNNIEKCNRLGLDSILGAKPAELVLILGGYSSHTTNIETLQFPEEYFSVCLRMRRTSLNLSNGTIMMHANPEQQPLEQQADSSQLGPSGVQIAQNRTPEKSSSVPDISPRKALDLVLRVPRQNNKRRQPSKKQAKASSLSESEEVVLNNSEEQEERLSDYENECVECREDFRKTKKKDD